MRDVRVGSDDRSEVIALLGRALDQGVLTVAEHDIRVIAVGTATYASQLVAQLADLPPEYAWLPPAVVAAPASRSSGRGALIFGILSVPTSFCVAGGLLGVVAIVLSLRGERPRGMSAALLGRVLGIVGVALSLAALFAILWAMRNPVGP